MVQNKQGIDSDDEVRARGPVARFFLSGWNNLVRLMASNALFVIFNIPSIILSFFISGAFVPLIAPLFIDLKAYIDPVTGSDAAILELYFLLVFFGVNALVSSTLVCIGPFQAGFAKVYKDIRNNTSVSFFSSFSEGMKTNWKKSLAAMIIGLLITPVLLLAIYFYFGMNSVTGSVIGVVFAVLLVAFVLIQNFVYQMIVSTDLKLSKIYKNALIFLFVRFIPCLGAASVVIVFYAVLPLFLLLSASYLTLGIFMFLYTFVVISWVQYFLSCFSGSLIDRYVASEE